MVGSFALKNDLQLQLFDALILPILKYECELLGFGNNCMLEKNQLQFYRNVLKIRSSTLNVITYRELGRITIYTIIKVRMVCFWNKHHTNENKISNILYRIMFYLKRITRPNESTILTRF